MQFFLGAFKTPSELLALTAVLGLVASTSHYMTKQAITLEQLTKGMGELPTKQYILDTLKAEREELTKEIDTKLSKQIGDLDTKLSKQIGDLDTKLSKQIGDLDTKASVACVGLLMVVTWMVAKGGAGGGASAWRGSGGGAPAGAGG